jgi:hypothetical protein
MWYLQVAQGSNATTPFVAVETVYIPKSGRAHEVFTWHILNPSDDVVVQKSMSGAAVFKPFGPKTAYFLANQLPQDLANNSALANFVQKARQAQTSFQGGVFLGELRETISLLRSPVKSLRQGINAYLETLKKRSRSIRRAPRARRKSQLKTILSDTWLEYSFGWIPAVADIDAGLTTITDSLVRDWPPRKLVIGFGRDRETYRNGTSIMGTNTTPFIQYANSQTTECFIKYYGMVTIGTNSLGSSRRVGFDLSNFVPTLWELTPYSFLADYFLNIQDIISAATLQRSTVLWMSKTVVCSDEMAVTSPIALIGNGNSNLSKGSFVDAQTGVCYRRKVVSRNPYYGSIVPDLEFSIPGVGKKWLNMAALLSNSRRTSKQINRYLNG